MTLKDRRLLLSLRLENILVKVNGKWLPLPRWLEEQTDSVWDKQNALTAQRKWWSKNGKHFIADEATRRAPSDTFHTLPGSHKASRCLRRERQPRERHSSRLKDGKQPRRALRPLL